MVFTSSMMRGEIETACDGVTDYPLTEIYNNRLHNEKLEHDCINNS